ncbi:MAG TPA: hypothetical protein ENG34_01230 [Candidatus Aenigmarchaeota archaeon]|nr:hypothetical protein [Candidatus Aenigmarchaeota archaeon]
MKLPSNLLFKLGRVTNLIIKGEDIYKVEREAPPGENYFFLKEKHPLIKVDTIPRLEELYKIRFKEEIEKWKEEKLRGILKDEEIKFSMRELELRRFIVNYIIPNFGIYPRFKEKNVRKKERRKRKRTESIWKSMLEYRDYDLDTFALLNFGKPKIYKLEESREPLTNKIHVRIDGIDYYFTEFEHSFNEVDRDYTRAIERFFFREVLEKARKSPQAEYKALGNAIEAFNKAHERRGRGIIRNSSRTYTIYAETPERYALYCKLCSTMERKPIYHVFKKGRIEIKVHDDLSYEGPRLARPYPHPHVWQESGHREICYGDFGVDYLVSKGEIPADDSDLSVRGLHIALWLINGIRGLTTSTIEHGTYITHEPFRKVSFEEIKEKRIPITNVKRKVVLSV